MKKSPMLLILWASLVNLMACPAVFAQDMSPAHFGERLSDFIESLDLPVIAEGTVFLTRCAAHITVTGAFRNTVCYHDDENSEVSRAVRKQVEKAVTGMEIKPALIGGAAEPVWFNFSIAYRQTGESQQIQVFENHLYNRERLGVNYTGAQRYNLSSWRCRSGRGIPLMLVVKLSAAGEILDIQASTEGRCSRSVIRAVRNSKFIPARLNGENVDSVYMEAFF